MTPTTHRAFVMKTFKLLLSTLAIFAMATAAQAAVLLDFQFTDGPPQTGAAVIGSSGDIWNSTSNASGGTLALNNVGGTASGVSLTWSGGSAVSSEYQVTGNGFYGTSYRNLMTAHIAVLGSTASTLALTGLNSALTYNVYLYTQPNAWYSGDAAGRKITFSTSGLTTSLPVTTLGSDPTLSVFTLGTNYVEFVNVAPDASGNLTINYQGLGPSGEADLNGFQIQSVPEPGTWMLLALTGTFFMVTRRRRRD